MSASHDSVERTAFGVAQCIEISGTDARAFAQAQFSGDVRALQPLRWQWNAWLDAKGLVRALMHLADPGDGRLVALLRGGDAQVIATELKKYVLRSRVGIEPLHSRYASIGAAITMHEVRAESDALALGYGGRSLWIESTARAEDAKREREFRLPEIVEGWPRLPPGSDQQFLPPALGLEHLQAVSFSKGCYPGQEIAARLHYRGGHKRRLAHVAGNRPLRAGEPLRGGSRDVVIEAVENGGEWHGLAVIDSDIHSLSISSEHDSTLIRVFEA